MHQVMEMKSAGEFGGHVEIEGTGLSDFETSEASEEELFYVKKLSSKGKGSIWITLYIQGKPVKMELDNGSARTMMSCT